MYEKKEVTKFLEDMSTIFRFESSPYAQKGGMIPVKMFNSIMHYYPHFVFSKDISIKKTSEAEKMEGVIFPDNAHVSFLGVFHLSDGVAIERFPKGGNLSFQTGAELTVSRQIDNTSIECKDNLSIEFVGDGKLLVDSSEIKAVSIDFDSPTNPIVLLRDSSLKGDSISGEIEAMKSRIECRIGINAISPNCWEDSTLLEPTGLLRYLVFRAKGGSSISLTKSKVKIIQRGWAISEKWLWTWDYNCEGEGENSKESPEDITSVMLWLKENIPDRILRAILSDITLPERLYEADVPTEIRRMIIEKDLR